MGSPYFPTHAFLCREPNSDPGIVRWSAPCFISGSLGGLGPLFGATRTESVTLGMAQTVVNRFVQRGRRITGGMDWSFVAGSSRAVHSDIVTAPLSTWGVISVDSASGAIIGTGLLAGIIEVRKDINESHYGPVSTADILLGKVPPPPELAPLYEELTRIVLEQTNDGGGVPAGDLASKRILSGEGAKGRDMAGGRDAERMHARGHARVVSDAIRVFAEESARCRPLAVARARGKLFDLDGASPQMVHLCTHTKGPTLLARHEMPRVPPPQPWSPTRDC